MVHRGIHHPINGLSVEELGSIWIFDPKEHFCYKNKPKNVQSFSLQLSFKESNHLLLASLSKTNIVGLCISEVINGSFKEGYESQT